MIRQTKGYAVCLPGKEFIPSDTARVGATPASHHSVVWFVPLYSERSGRINHISCDISFYKTKICFYKTVLTYPLYWQCRFLTRTPYPQSAEQSPHGLHSVHSGAGAVPGSFSATDSCPGIGSQTRFTHH